MGKTYFFYFAKSINGMSLANVLCQQLLNICRSADYGLRHDPPSRSLPFCLPAEPPRIAYHMSYKYTHICSVCMFLFYIHWTCVLHGCATRPKRAKPKNKTNEASIPREGIRSICCLLVKEHFRIVCRLLVKQQQATACKF